MSAPPRRRATQPAAPPYAKASWRDVAQRDAAKIAAEAKAKAEAEEKRKAEAAKRAEAGQQSLSPEQSASSEEEHTGMLRAPTAEELGKLPQLADIINAEDSKDSKDSSAAASKGGKAAAERSRLFARFCRVGPCKGDQS